MNRRCFASVLCALLLVLALVPLGADAQGQKVRARPSDPSGVPATVAYPNPLGVKPLAPAVLAMAPAEAPRPETDMSRSEWTRLKREALTHPGKGGKEVHIDTTPSPLAPNTGTNFTGLGQNGWIPYDAAVAVGPNHIVEMTNSQWAIYTKVGSQVSITGFDTWWGTTAGTPFDPKCFYDPAANRFVIMAVSVDTTQSFYHFSVSQTSDPTGAWFNYMLDARVDGTTVSTNWADFPNLGYDDNAVYLTSNQFSLAASVFQHAKLRVFSKAQMYAGLPLTFTDFIDMRNSDNTKAFTLQPARSLSSATSEHLVNTRSSGGTSVTLWRVDNAPSAPTLTRQATVTVNFYTFPPDAPQPGTGILVATNDQRAYDTVTRNGMLHLAFGENVSSRAAMRYLRIDTASSALVKDISYTQAGVHYFFPAVAVDSADNVYFVFSRSSSTEFASLYQTGMTPADTAIQASALVKAGVSTNTSGRWGDYSGVAIDPADPLAIWVYGGWANTSNRWATSNASLTFGGTPPPVPTLASVAPNNGNQGQNVNVTLTGTGFIAGAVVNVSGGGDVTVSNTVVNPNGLSIAATFNIAGGAATGARNVSVTTAGGTSANQTFTVNAAPAGPTLNNISPNNGNAVNPVNVTLNGGNFDASAVINVSGTGVTVSNTQLVNPNQLTASFTIAGTAATGGRSVTVTTNNGTSGAVTFTVNAPPLPTLNAPTPAVINPNGSFNMALTGTNFVAPASITLTTGTGVSASNIAVVSPTSITATFTTTAGASIGGHLFRVTTPGGNSNTRNLDVLNLPVLNSVTPNSGAPGTAVNVTLSGANFYNGSAILVAGGGVTVSSVVKVSNSTLTATFTLAPGALAGPRNVTVSNLAGQSLPQTFTVSGTAPTLGSVAPNNGLQAQNVNVTLAGTGFVSGATVNVSGANVTVSNINVVDPNTITAMFNIAATAATGARNVTVTTTGGTSGAQTFTVNPASPQLGSVAPNNGAAGTAVGVTLNGSFFDATSSIAVSGGDVTVSNIVFGSNLQLTATFTIASGAPAGGRNVTVTTLGGTSNAVTFTVNSAPPLGPTLANIAPNSGNAVNPVNVTLNGGNFDASAVINLSGAGVTVTNTQLVSANQLTATLLIAGTAATGGRSVTVTTTNGTSGAVTFTVNAPPPPTLNPPSPGVINPNNSFNMTLTGTNFVAPASITFTTGTGVSASNIVVVSPTTITATFTTTVGASIGGHQFRVTTPGGNSNTRNLDVLNLPVLNSVTPNSGAAGTALNVTLSGANFYNGSTIQVAGGDVTVSNLVKVSNSTLTATFTIAPGAPAGGRTVTVTTLAGTSNAVVFTGQ